MRGFCGSIVLAFILGVKLFDYVVVDGVNLCEPGLGEKVKWRIWPQDRGRGEGIKPSGCHVF